MTEYFCSLRELLEKELDALVPKKETSYHKLFEAARYSLLNGGKRLRPLLVLATADALSGSYQKALRPACAVELIHTYSLIHDDLPCMDDDDFRRGKPSLHKAFSEAHAVLTGDFLLSYAFEILAEDPLLEENQKVQLIAQLAKGAGGEGMIAGQVIDIESMGREVDDFTLETMHRHKTGALITAAVLMGGIAVKASSSDLQHLKNYSQAIGLAFQIMDDVLDVENIESHGKNRSSDLSNNKTTYVTLFGLEKAKQQARELVEKAEENLSYLECQTQHLRDLADSICK